MWAHSGICPDFLSATVSLGMLVLMAAVAGGIMNVEVAA
jgi:hypothetical protein